MAAKTGETLNDIAMALYALPPAQFTAARNARAAEVADPALAKRVRALRKPLLAAWVVNTFASKRPEQLDEALDLAEQLRQAQADLDAPTLTQLSRQRRALVHALARHAVELARSAGENVTQPTADAVEATFNAAMFDRDAAAAVTSGRLTRPLEASGVPLADVVGGESTARRAARVQPTDELEQRRALKEADRVLAAAQDDLQHAEREHTDLERRAGAVAKQLDRLSVRRQELEDALADVRDEVDRAERERRALEGDSIRAASALAKARQAAETAQSDRDRVASGDGGGH